MSTKRNQKIPVVLHGHSGFIGKALYDHLTQCGYRVICASSRECNLLDLPAVERFYKKLNKPFQVVCCSGLSYGNSPPKNNRYPNGTMVSNLFHTLLNKPVTRIIFLSSVDVYGLHPKTPITEQTLPNPHKHYAKDKWVAETIINQSSLAGKSTIFRLPGVYGPGDKGKSLLGQFRTALRHNKKLVIYNKGRSKRDYVYINDVCDILERALKKPYPGLFNLVTGRSLPIIKMVKILSKKMGKSDFRAKWVQKPDFPDHLIFQNRRLNSIRSCRTLYSIEKGLDLYLSHGL